MKIFIIYLFLFFYYISLAHAQNGGIANYWYFGRNAGITFNTGTPTFIPGPFDTMEGTAVISDINGNLLFSTDGVTVYNSNNIQMPNGFGLSGQFSSTQSALIVPNPNNTNQYYLFTSPAQVAYYGGFDGIAYSIVDMTLHGGLGDITTKNVPLLHPAAEKLTAVKHCDGSSYWVICHEWNSDAFYAYQVTATGINAPIISHVGSFYQNFSVDNKEAIGYLKASPNGQRLAAARDNIPNRLVKH